MATVLKAGDTWNDKKLKTIGTNPIKPDGVDKVTGRARFGADIHLPGMLHGKLKRSPHPHARIISIDTSKAEALAGVKAVVTSADFPDMKPGTPFDDQTRNMMARDKVFYDGHAVAAVAATSVTIARKAVKLIEVTYEVLPHIMDIMEAMKPGAPLLRDNIFTKGIDPKPDKPSNITERCEYGKGDVEKGFAEADVIVEQSFKTKPMHQSYIEPQACVASYTEDGQAEVWCTTQGHFRFRQVCANVLAMDVSKICVTQSEMGGGFGGKNYCYIEPVAITLSRKSSSPVKIVLSRSEVFRGTGPVSGTNTWFKMGCTKDGKMTAAEADLVYETGPFAGSMFANAPMAGFTRYDLENVKAVGQEVVTNRPKVAAFRAPCVPPTVFGVEQVVDEMARKIEMDPIDFRLKNAAEEGYTTVFGQTFGPIGFRQVLECAKTHPHYTAPLGPNQGRGVASGFWFNRGGPSSATININEDGTATLITGNPDVAGSRISLAMIAAEELGIDVDKVRPSIADTNALGYNHVTAGSRVTFSSGTAILKATRDAIKVACERAAEIWDVPAEGVVYEDGMLSPAGANVGEFDPLTLAEVAKRSIALGGSIAGHAEVNAKGAGPGFGLHIVDVEVDKETGRVEVKRYTVVQDAGRAIHPRQVEGQFQGGAVQGIGWALNEEYVYGEDGRLQNPGFLDYRIPVASDVPMIETVIVEVPNPLAPYGLRGVGEVPVIPTMAAVANAVRDAIGVRMYELPMSPPKVLKAIEEAAKA